MANIKIEGLTPIQADCICEMFNDGEILNFINAEMNERYPTQDIISEVDVIKSDNHNPTHIIRCN